MFTYLLLQGTIDIGSKLLGAKAWEELLGATKLPAETRTNTGFNQGEAPWHEGSEALPRGFPYSSATAYNKEVQTAFGKDNKDKNILGEDNAIGGTLESAANGDFSGGMPGLWAGSARDLVPGAAYREAKIALHKADPGAEALMADSKALPGITMISFSGGGQAYGYTSHASSSRSYTFSFTRKKNSMFEGSDGLDLKAPFGGAEFDIGRENEWSIEIGGVGSTGRHSAATVGFALADPDLGDMFDVMIAVDPVFATPVFRTVGGRSSCPKVCACASVHAC